MSTATRNKTRHIHVRFDGLIYPAIADADDIVTFVTDDGTAQVHDLDHLETISTYVSEMDKYTHGCTYANCRNMADSPDLPWPVRRCYNHRTVDIGKIELLDEFVHHETGNTTKTARYKPQITLLRLHAPAARRGTFAETEHHRFRDSMAFTHLDGQITGGYVTNSLATPHAFASNTHARRDIGMRDSLYVEWSATRLAELATNCEQARLNYQPDSARIRVVLYPSWGVHDGKVVRIQPPR